MLNRISIIGNLTRDPEMKEVSGTNCLNFTIASDSRNKGADGKPTTNFYTCTAWRQAADTIAKYVHKGDKLYVDGDLVIRQYKDNNGNDRTAVCVNVQNFEFLNTRSTSNTPQSAEMNQTARRPQVASADDELPF